MKNKNVFQLLFLLVTFMFIIGCSGTFNIYTYTTDLIDVAESKEDLLYSNVNVVVVGLDSEDDIAFLRNNLDSFSNERIVEVEYMDSLSFDTKIPVISDDYHSDHDFSKNLLYLIASEDESEYKFRIDYNHDLLQKINDYIYEEYWQKAVFDDFKIKITLDNDIRGEDLLFTAYSVYVFGEAYPFEYSTNFAHRDKLEIEISEVFRKSILSNKDIHILFSIKK
jgi:hypothetical protein